MVRFVMAWPGGGRVLVCAVVLALVAGVGPAAVVGPVSASVTPINGAGPSEVLQWQPLGEPSSGGRMDAVAVNPNDTDHVLVAGDILGSGVSFDGGRSWWPTTGWTAWEHSDFTFAPGQSAVPPDRTMVWAATQSGPFRSDDGGRTWVSRRNGMPTGPYYPAAVEKILFDPSAPGTMYAFGGDHRQIKRSQPQQVPNFGMIWRSVDGGDNWSTVGMGQLPGNIMAVSFGGGVEADRVMWAAVAEDGLWRSNDLGSEGSWTAVRGGLPAIGGTVHMTGVVADPIDPDLVHVTIGVRSGEGDRRDGIGGVWRTENGGSSWTLIEPGLADAYNATDMLHIDASADGSVIWAADQHYGDGKGIYRSVDRGRTWKHMLSRSNSTKRLVETDMAIPNSIGAWWVEAAEAKSKVAYAATSDILLRTEDKGRSWRDSLNSIQPRGLVRGNGYSGWVARNIEFDPYRPDVMLVQGMDSLHAGLSTDGGFSWDVRQPGLPPYGGANDAAFGPDGLVFIALGQSNSTTTDELIYRSIDGGITWGKVAIPANSQPGPAATAVHLNSENPAVVMAVTGGVVRRSTNALDAAGSVTWSTVEVPGQARFLEGTSAADRIYLSTSEGVMVSDDGGSTFVSTADESGTGGAGPASRVRIAADPSNPRALWAASDDFADQGVHRYEVGQGWTESELPNGAGRWARDVAVNPADPDQIAVVTGQDPYVDINGGTGVWLSDDGGATWANQNANLPILRFNVVEFTPDGDELIIGSGGRGFFRADLRRTDPNRPALQAESMTVSAGSAGVYRVGTSQRSSDGRHLRPTGTWRDFVFPQREAPTATFTFTLVEGVDQAAVRLRVRRGGSVFVRLDDGPWTVLEPPSGSGRRIGQIDLPTAADGLRPGRYHLQIRRRSGALQIDEIEVSTVPHG